MSHCQAGPGVPAACAAAALTQACLQTLSRTDNPLCGCSADSAARYVRVLSKQSLANGTVTPDDVWSLPDATHDGRSPDAGSSDATTCDRHVCSRGTHRRSQHPDCRVQCSERLQLPCVPPPALLATCVISIAELRRLPNRLSRHADSCCRHSQAFSWHWQRRARSPGRGRY